MEKDKSQEVQSVVDSGVDTLADATVKGLRKRNLVLAIAVVGGILFGGSCEGKLSCVGKDAVGCSCTDRARASKKAPTKKGKLKTDFN